MSTITKFSEAAKRILFEKFGHTFVPPKEIEDPFFKDKDGKLWMKFDKIVAEQNTVSFYYRGHFVCSTKMDGFLQGTFALQGFEGQQLVIMEAA